MNLNKIIKELEEMQKKVSKKNDKVSIMDYIKFDVMISVLKGLLE